MFVVDDLVSWLIGRLADAGYQKLSTLLRGSEEARALKAAVTAAVQVTVGEIGPSDPEEAERVAGQINKAFRRREPVPLPPGQPTLLEALQAGIAGQLSARDDAGQPAASLPGIPVSDVAAKLTGHLVRQIQVRGSQPGPLTPLADQLNHDLTHLQGQRLEGMLAQVLDWLGGALAPPGGAAVLAGQPLADVRDPFALEVHRPVEPDVPQPGLPVYVPREHDAGLAEVVTAAAAGTSGIAVLVGGSSTGKTRACWQALDLLRGLEPGWRLWHPIDPQAALAELPGVEPRTVVWLNEAQRYLDTADSAGERVAAGLREKLRSPGRGPVVVLATLWPQYWDAVTAGPPGDPHAQARELLAGHDIPVPAAFTAAQQEQLRETGDVRLAQAAAEAQDGQVIQFLAGAPELLARYRNAPPAARALIDAAMDARRLGAGIGLPLPFLEAAAPGYLTDADWDALDDDWLEQALASTARPAKGVRGPVTRIRPRPASPRAPAHRPGSSGEQAAGGPDISLYRLADYLDQHGRAHRKGQIPPADFWAAAADHAFPADQAVLGDAAHARGLYRDAAQLHKNAAGGGNPRAVSYLSNIPDYFRGDDRPALWAAAHAPVDDPRLVAALLGSLLQAGAQEQVTALAERAAAQVPVDDPTAVARLLDSMRRAGAQGQVTVLARRAAAHVPVDPRSVARMSDSDPRPFAGLLDSMREAGAHEQVTTLAGRAAAQVSLDDTAKVAWWLFVPPPGLLPAFAPEQVAALLARDPAAQVSLDDPAAVARLLNWLREAGAREQVTVLAGRAAAQVPVDDPAKVAALLNWLREAGAREQVTVLAGRAAAQVPVDDPAAVARLLDGLREAGAPEVVAALLARDPAAQVSLDDPDAVATLLDRLREADAQEQVAALLARDPAAQVSLDEPFFVARLLASLREAGAQEQVTALAGRAAAQVPVDSALSVLVLRRELREADAPEQVTILAGRAAAHLPLDDPAKVATLLDSLRRASTGELVAALLRRDPAAHVSLENPDAVARLLDSLREAGAHEQVTALLRRDPAAHVRFTGLFYRDHVITLLDSLREAGAPEQVTALAGRLPGEGMFELFRAQQDNQDRFLFGREADGRPAKRWAWGDLDGRDRG